MRVWHALELEIARSAEAPVAGALWSAGTTGIEISEDAPDVITLRAYFDIAPDEAQMREAIVIALSHYSLPESALRAIRSLTIADQDWLAEWKKGYEPIEIGSRLLVTPSWKREEVDRAGRAQGRVIVEIDPGMAFGTGTHETTRGCLEMLEKYWSGGRLLDVGTGTGILAIAAAKLQPGAQVTGFDLDPEAIEVARENAEINGVSEEIELEVNRIDFYAGGDYDLVLANLTADVLEPLAEAFAAAVKRDGVLIASGILREQAAEVESAFRAAGFEAIESKPDGEWVTIALRRG